MARRCLKKGYRKEIQDYGPAKRVGYCKKYGKAGSRKGGKSRWCVFKGKSPIPTVCHTTKARAKKAATRLKKTCKRRIRIKRG